MNFGIEMPYSIRVTENQVTILNTIIPLGPAICKLIVAVPKLSEEELQTVFDDMTDDDIKEEEPILWVCKEIYGLIEKLRR